MLLAQEASVPVIDLVADPPQHGAPRDYEGRVGYSTKPKPRLPFRIRLESIQPGARSNELMIQLLFENCGKEAYPFPIGRDPDKVLGPGNRGRREFSLELTWRTPKHWQLLGVVSIFSASDTVESFATMPPGSSARIRFSLDSNQQSQLWSAVAGKEVEIRVECVEWRYEDYSPRLVMDSSIAPTGESENTLKLQMP
jgi:hypothetical protein